MEIRDNGTTSAINETLLDLPKNVLEDENELKRMLKEYNFCQYNADNRLGL